MEQGTTETVTTVLAAVPSVSGVTFTYDLTITASVIVAVVGGLIAWIRARNKALDDRISAVDGRSTRHEGRISKVEDALNYLPAKGDLHNLQMVVSEIRGELSAIRVGQEAASERAQRQDVVVQRVEDYLLKDSRR